MKDFSTILCNECWMPLWNHIPNFYETVLSYLSFMSWNHILDSNSNWWSLLCPLRSKMYWPVCHSVNLFILSFCKSVANSFWSVRVRDLIFHMSIPIRKTFPWIPTILTLWSWLCTLTYFLRTLNLLITVEHRVLELWYLTRVFHLIQDLCVSVSTNNSDRVTLSLEFDLFKNTLTLLTSKQWVLLIFHECFLWHNLSVAINIFYTLTLNLVSFLKTFTMLIIFDLALALILHLNIPYDEIFSWYLSFWPWDDQF